MANTEGMPDEFVQSLSTTGSSPAITTTSLSLSSQNRRRQQQKRTQNSLKKRMGKLAGGSPAAKVIQSSPNNHSRNSDMVANSLETNTGASSFPSEGHAATTVPLVGDIIEHSHYHNRRSNKNTIAKAPRLPRIQYGQSTATTTIKHRHTSGFPSVQDAPIGTFVKRRKKKQNHPIYSTNEGSCHKSETNSVYLKHNDHNNITFDINSSSKSNNGEAHRSLQEASHNDAQAMLSGMSLEEIKDHKEDIVQALSPELAAFLKNRGKKKKISSNSSSAIKPSVQKKQIRLNAPANTDPREESPSRKNLACDEKERLAKLFSSIRTHEDLDAAFQAEMKGDVFGIDNEESYDNNNKDQFLVACDLLRSTCPRQILWASRTVSLKLEELIMIKYSFKQQQQKQEEEQCNEKIDEKIEPPTATVTPTTTTSIVDLPALLSVSLRCLLDKALNSSCNYLLHTYALQSLYYLTIVYAHPGHDVIYYDSSLPSLASDTVSKACDNRACSDVLIFQENFMDDAVPSPSLGTAYLPMSVRPLVVDKTTLDKNDNNANTIASGAYMTSSSTASAMADGEAFKKDPMWTLLSKMKILPRLSFLLNYQQHVARIPVEAFVAICGIISMVGQRSPGAASAIVQHETLISQILTRMLEQIQRRSESRETINGNNDPIIYYAMRLFCILSRQSRVAAEGIPFEEILPPLLHVGFASSYQEFRTQQLALCLWRTKLRYGLGLEALASMLTVSARHLALPYSNKFSLSPEFIAAFTLVLECVKIVRKQNSDALDARSSAEAGTQKLSTVNEGLAGIINPDTMVIVETATKLMASTIRLILPKSASSVDDLSIDSDITKSKSILRYRWNASRLLYLSAWLHLCYPSVKLNSDATSVEDHISADDQEALLLTMQTWAEPGGDVERGWNLVARWCFPSIHPEELSQDGPSVKIEAAASGFIHGYFSVALVLLRSKVSNRRIEDVKRSLHKKVIKVIIEGMKSALRFSASKLSSTQSNDTSSACREGWINQSHFAVAKFCFHSMSVGLIGSSSDLLLVRSMVFSLLGRLQKGNESIAAVLYSSDLLFQSCGNPVQEDTPTESSPISSMFLGEVCGSVCARKQLDHSFKLQHGFGITSAEFGAFELDSLLGCAEQAKTVRSNQSDTVDQTFPLGKLWLWKCLSGSVRLRDDSAVADTKEASDVIAAVLDLILDLDEIEEVMDTAVYAGRIPMGSKLYYLMNICLQPEHVLRDERIANSGELVLDRYLQNFGANTNDVADFCQECLDHSGQAAKILRKDGDGEDALEEKDKELLDNFANAITFNFNDSRISSEQLRAMETFVEDLVTAYRDYGAQYDFFTKCIRVFLLPIFPISIRCRGLRELENMLHLLTLSKESEDKKEMSQLLSKSLVGGVHSNRDAAEILDAATRILEQDSSSPRPLQGYMRHYCVGLLVRNFASSLLEKQGIETAKLRLKRLNARNVKTICNATLLLLQTGGTKSSLVAAVIRSCAENNNQIANTQILDQWIDDCVTRFLSPRTAGIFLKHDS